jgi:hypothetical protein
LLPFPGSLPLVSSSREVTGPRSIAKRPRLWYSGSEALLSQSSEVGKRTYLFDSGASFLSAFWHLTSACMLAIIKSGGAATPEAVAETTRRWSSQCGCIDVGCHSHARGNETARRRGLQMHRWPAPARWVGLPRGSVRLQRCPLTASIDNGARWHLQRQ